MIQRNRHANTVRELSFHISFPVSLELDALTMERYRRFLEDFLQKMANRRVMGAVRYSDPPVANERYLTRLRKELAEYAVSGNTERLVNLANYAFLEWAAPENKKAHYDPFAFSVTRGKEKPRRAR